MSGSPFVGPRPFETEDRDRFFGRTRELEELLSLIIAHRAVLIYAQSGAGKTSLLKAGVIPRLGQQEFKVLRPARVQGLLPANLSPERVTNIFVFHALLHWATDLRDEAAAEKYARTKLVDFLRTVLPPPRADEESRPPMVIVFDQFEEFFTANTHRWEERAPFFQQMTEALDELPTLKVVFVMREEYIAQLEPFADLLPEKLRTRMHLERLRGNSALSAVVKPFQSRGISFDTGAAEKLMSELSEMRVSEGDKFRETRGEFVEPVQLQVVCQSLWENLEDEWKNGGPAEPESQRLITPDFVESYGDVNEALGDYYQRSVAKAAAEGGIGEGELRRWISTALITPTGTRGLAFRGARGEPGTIPGHALKCLEDAHVIRREERGGTITHELTHDRFIEPVQRSNKAWLAAYEKAEDIRARLEEHVRQKPDDLLDLTAVREAESYLNSPAVKILGISREARQLVTRSRKELEEARKRQAQELEEAKRRAEEEKRLHELETARAEALLRSRSRERVYGTILTILVALVVAGVGYVFHQRRRLAEEVKTNELREQKRALEMQVPELERRGAAKLMLSRAREELLSEDADSTNRVTALRSLASALRNNPEDLEAAQLTANLLLQGIWCPPLTPDLRSQKDAFLAATLTPGADNGVFVLAADGQLLRYKQTDANLQPVAQLFQKPPDASTQSAQPGVASFSPDGRWLFLVPPFFTTTAPTPQDGTEPPPPTNMGLVQLWSWTETKGTYERAGSDVAVPPLTFPRTNLTWIGSDQVVLINSRFSAGQCRLFQVAADGPKERPEFSSKLTEGKTVAVARNADGTQLATISWERMVTILRPENLELIPGAAGGKNSYELSDGFQPNAIVFGPTDGELTLSSWSGVRIFNLRDGHPRTELPPTFRDQYMRITYGLRESARRLVAKALYGRVIIGRTGSKDQGDPILFRGSMGLPQFSADGTRVLILSGGVANVFDTVRVCDLQMLDRPPPSPAVVLNAQPAPPWLADLAGSVSALGDGDSGAFLTLQQLRDRYPERKTGDAYHAVWERFFPEQK